MVNKHSSGKSLIRFHMLIDKVKTKIFPTSADVLGWIWKESVFLKHPLRQIGLKTLYSTYF